MDNPLDESAEMERIVIQALERLADGTICIHCGADVAHFRQVRRSYYAEPCGHRQGQGSATFFNDKIAAKQAAATEGDPGKRDDDDRPANPS